MEKRIDDTFIVFTNVSDGADHSRDSVLIQAAGKSFGMFDMTSITGDAAYDIYTLLKKALNK